MKQIIIFGGSFDPPHIGHLNLYLAIKKEIKFDRFIITPSNIPPLKTHKNIASAKDRINMLKIMFKKYKDVEIDDYEINKSGISYTIDTIKYLANKYINSQLFLAVGLDRYEDFKKWHQYKEILSYVKLIVVSRNKLVKNNNKYIAINMPLINISSTQLRTNPEIKFLTKQIAKYISNNGLYIEQQIKPLLSDRRYNHTLRVCELANELTNAIAPKLKLKAYIASMYHDVCKEFDEEKIKKYARDTNKHMHILHGKAGSNYIKQHFNISNKNILDAISEHVKPKTNVSLLTKIVYCADKLEPNRTNNDIKGRLEFIDLVKKDINLAFKTLFKEVNSKYKN